MSKKMSGAGGTPRKVTSPYLGVVISAAYGLLVILILLLIFSFILSSKDISSKMTAPIATLILVAGGMIGGYLCGKALKKNGILNGILIGCLQFMVLAIISLAMPQNEVGILALYKFLVLAVSACIGSILGVNRRSKMKAAAIKKR